MDQARKLVRNLGREQVARAGLPALIGREVDVSDKSEKSDHGSVLRFIYFGGEMRESKPDKNKEKRLFNAADAFNVFISKTAGPRSVSTSKE